MATGLWAVPLPSFTPSELQLRNVTGPILPTHRSTGREVLASALRFEALQLPPLRGCQFLELVLLGLQGRVLASDCVKLSSSSLCIMLMIENGKALILPWFYKGRAGEKNQGQLFYAGPDLEPLQKACKGYLGCISI